MLISSQSVTARMLISLRNQQDVNFTQSVCSKMLISGQKGKRMLISLSRTHDGKDADFTKQPARCQFHARNA